MLVLPEGQSASAGYFFERLVPALRAEGVRLRPESEMYVLSLLDRTKHEPPKRESITYELLEAENEADRKAIRAVGDRALLLRGLWWRSIPSEQDANHLAFLGIRAYSELETQPFDELARKFTGIANALMGASLAMRFASEDNGDLLLILRAYEHNHHPILGRLLRERGIRLDVQC